MPIDPAVAAATEASHHNVVWLIWLDIDTDPLRATSDLYDRTFGASETGDEDLDGETYETQTAGADTDPLIATIGEVVHSEDGTETVELSLSGLILKDTDLLNLFGDRTKYQGRWVRLWWYFKNPADGSIIGGKVIPYFTGKMVRAPTSGDAHSQTITVKCEQYYTVLGGSSGRTWGQQKEYDSGDTSQSATLAAASGTQSPDRPEGWVPGIGFGGGLLGGFGGRF